MSASVKQVSQPPPHARDIGRYVLYDQIGSGGMATVHFGRLRGPAGFARTVAIKRLHPHLASNPQFAEVFVSEARLAARVRHPNVVSLLDVIALQSGELLLVMEYVHGETLAALLGSARLAAATLPPALAAAVMIGVLHGLHAAHEAVNESGLPLGLVHGDVSPRNIIVDGDGCARVLDFGVAKIGSGAAQGLSRLGTPGYMSPEKLEGDRFDRRADLFSAGAVLWEMLCLRRLFPRGERGSDSARAPVVPPSTFNPAVPPALDAVVLRALGASREDRFPTARAFATELERACPPAPSAAVSAWVTSTRGPALQRRSRALARIETVSMAELLDVGQQSPRPVERPPARLPEPPLARGLPPEPTIVELPAAEEDRPTVVESVTPASSSAQLPPAKEEAETVCEPRSSARLRVRSPLTLPAVDEVTAAVFPPVRATRRLPSAARSVLPAVGLLAAMYMAAAFDGKPVSTPVRASSAAAAPALPAAAPPAQPGPPICVAPRLIAPTGPPDVAAAVTVEPAPSPPPEVPVARPPAPRAGPDAATAIVGLNRRAIAAYEQLEASRALRLLGAGLRLCQQAGLERGELAALTHLNMGIVLAGGFKQRGLAVQQFRRARAIRPGIQPSGSLVSPEITAAFAEAL
jgi:serine/threonine protein kinase